MVIEPVLAVNVGTPVPVGAVVMKLIPFAPETDMLVAGPELTPSVMDPAFNWGRTVPAEQPVTVTLKLVPDDALGVKTHPVAVPAFVKSDPVRPEIGSDITKSKDNGSVAVFND